MCPRMVKILCLRDFLDMQKNNAFCSICTINYSSYAGVLNESLREVGHDDPHYVLIVDYSKASSEIIDKFNFIPVPLQDLSIPGVEKMIEKYSPFELANALKPFFMEWLLKNHNEIENLLYLDTDIYVYAPFNDILNYMESEESISVILTPHVFDYAEYRKLNDYSLENMFMTFGLYNGGFYAIRNDSNGLQFLEWHKNRLSEFGFNLPDENMFVDQKILDFAPLFFNFFGLYRDKSYNVSHWNGHERQLEKRGGIYYVENKRLVFYHFSQININESNFKKSYLGGLCIENNIVLQQMLKEYLNKLDKYDFDNIKKIPYQYLDKYSKPEAKINLLETTRAERDRAQASLAAIEIELENSKKELENIKGSREWKAAIFFGKFVKKMMPKGTFQRKIVGILWKSVKPYVVYIFKKKNQIGDFLYFFKYVAVRSGKNKRRRRINRNSKKILFIGHSYHAKTKSSEFIIDYLRDYFEVEVLFDNSWQGGGDLDLSFIDDKYYAVIFWQNLPSGHILNKINNENIIFFPMFDGVSRKYIDWCDYYNLKIINFSKTLHKKMKRWGFETMHIQYFPKIKDFNPGDCRKVFFWQRLTSININILEKILGNVGLAIHIHTAVDPGQKFIMPNQKQEHDLKITYSNWLETREEMWDLIRQGGIYVAPREMEGIGMSFLEAMAMGKAVVAVNNPTMNEYIKHGKNGYLFDLKNPKKIDFSNIQEIQKNTYEYIKNGFEIWEKEKYKIIDFIKSN